MQHKTSTSQQHKCDYRNKNIGHKFLVLNRILAVFLRK